MLRSLFASVLMLAVFPAAALDAQAPAAAVDAKMLAWRRDLHQPAHYDDVLEVCVRVLRIGNSSLQFAIGIFRGDLHLIGGELIYVNSDPEARKASPVPAALRAIIDDYESGARGS